MQKLNDDCYYFVTSSCAKGSSCTYRHNSAVLTCNVMCPAWLRGNCTDPACQLRHIAIQRPTISNTKLCYYENTPTGCLKLDCTFAHLRPRPSLRNSTITRSATTNLVNKDVVKSTTITDVHSTVSNIPSTNDDALPNPTPEIDSSQTTMVKVEIPVQSEVVPVVIPNGTVPVRIEMPTENEQAKSSTLNDVKDLSKDTETTTTQSRTIGNRNVVIADASSISNRKIVQGTTNRVVVSSDRINSSKKIAKDDSDSDLDDLVQEEENNTTKTNSVIDISFPCSAPSIINRFSNSIKTPTLTNDTKPIRLNRDRLPAAKITISNSNNTAANGEKTSAGTEISKDDERRASRIERFQNRSIPSSRSVVSTTISSSTAAAAATTTTTTVSTRNAVTSSTNERKRPMPESSMDDAPPVKRHSSRQDNNRHQNTTTIGDLCSSPSNSRRISDRQRRRSSSSSSSSYSSSSSSPSQRKSPPRQAYPSQQLPMDDFTWKKQVDEFLAKTTQKKQSVIPKPILSQPVPLLSLRPRFIPQLQQQQQSLLTHQQQHQNLANSRYRSSHSQRPRHPSKVHVPRPSPPVVNSLPSVPTKSIEEIPLNKTSPIESSSTTLLDEDEDENKLLEPDESNDVVDAVAFIDEVLFEADNLLEFM